MTQTDRFDHHRSRAQAFGVMLKARRTAAGLPQDALATRLGVSRPYLSHLEHGQYLPSPSVLTKLARCLHVPIDDLYALTGYLPTTDLPSFGPYLRAKHPDWPESVWQELEDYYEFIKTKYALQ